MNFEKEKNTVLFYEELKSDSCNIELLYSLSLKGIYLYKPLFRYKKIRYHEYVVDISLMNHQYCMIYNDKQYKRLTLILKKHKNTNIINKYIKLILLNEYIIKNIVDDNINYDNFTYLGEHSNIPLYYLLKYNCISNKIFDYFKYDDISYILIIVIVFINVFYFKEDINLIDINKYIGKSYISSSMINYFDRDIKALEYIIINVLDKFKSDYCCKNFRVGPFYPLNLLKKVSSKTFKPNILYFKHPDKNIEDLFNSICGDFMLDFLYSRNSIDDIIDYFDRYIVEYKIPKDMNNFTIVNYDEFKINRNKINNDRKKNSFIKQNDLWFGNKDLFNIDFELKKYYLIYENRYDFSYNEIEMFYTLFKKNYLNDIEVAKILEDPEYIIYKSENDATIENNYFYTIIIRCCIIGSLIHNNKSKFIISILTELLSNYVPLTYNPQENKLRFDRVERIMEDYEENEEWIEDYDDIFYNTIVSTSNDTFNRLFTIYYLH